MPQITSVWLKRLVKVVLVKSIMESSMARYVYGSVSPKIDVYAFGVVLYELISAKEALMRSGGASGAELKGLVALVIINDFAMELLQIETQRKDEARREALRVANEERKKLKAEAAQIRAQERKIAQQEFRETLVRFFFFFFPPFYEFPCAHQVFDGLLICWFELICTSNVC
ncbi:uncharacterized protein [Arachis hypogaea]|uniref:uncharacterized protein isoform X1 n=1 Tax=Arachis hypogaea TaxID=3818 RepID=UPI003B212F79